MHLTLALMKHLQRLFPEARPSITLTEDGTHLLVTLCRGFGTPSPTFASYKIDDDDMLRHAWQIAEDIASAEAHRIASTEPQAKPAPALCPCGLCRSFYGADYAGACMCNAVGDDGPPTLESAREPKPELAPVAPAEPTLFAPWKMGAPPSGFEHEVHVHGETHKVKLP